MKVKITDFLISMGKICDEHNNSICYKCPLNYEGETFHGCLKDDMSNPKHAEMIEEITLKYIYIKERE